MVVKGSTGNDQTWVKVGRFRSVGVPGFLHPAAEVSSPITPRLSAGWGAAGLATLLLTLESSRCLGRKQNPGWGGSYFLLAVWCGLIHASAFLLCNVN